MCHAEPSLMLEMQNKCELTCLTLKVHSQDMHDARSLKCFGNILTAAGGVRETITDRRNKGWGKVAQILGILGEVPLGQCRIEVSLLYERPY